MIPPMSALKPDEHYIQMVVDLDEVPELPSARGLPLFALKAVLRFAEHTGAEVTWGPEVLEKHDPEFPGDRVWVIAVAVFRSPTV